MQQQGNSSRGHRRFQSEPLYSSEFMQGTFDDLDLDVIGEHHMLNGMYSIASVYSAEMIAVDDSLDMSLGSGLDLSHTAILENMKSDSTHEEEEGNLTGLKHNRSVDQEEQYGHSYMRKDSNSQKINFPPAKAPSTAKHRRARSMPEVDMNIMDLFQPAPQAHPHPPLNHSSSATSNASFDAMLPALGSMSMDNVDVFKVTSEDWTEAWNQIKDDGVTAPKSTGKNGNSFPGFSSSSSSGEFMSTANNTVIRRLHGDGMTTIEQGTTSPGSHVHEQSHYEKTVATGPLTSCIPNTKVSSDPFMSFQNPVATTSRNQSDQTPFDIASAVYHPGKPASDSNSSLSIPKHRRSKTTGTIYSDFLNQDTLDGSRNIKGSVSHVTGISDMEYHPTKVQRSFDTTSDDGLDRKGNARGRYRCGRCGQPKVNHECPYVAETSMRSIATQAETQIYTSKSHPFNTERTITVGGRKAQKEHADARVVPPQPSRAATSSNASSKGSNVKGSSNVLEMDRFKGIRILHPSMMPGASNNSSV